MKNFLGIIGGLFLLNILFIVLTIDNFYNLHFNFFTKILTSIPILLYLFAIVLNLGGDFKNSELCIKYGSIGLGIIVVLLSI